VGFIEGFVSTVEEVHFREVQFRVMILIQGSILTAQVPVHSWSALGREFTVEDEHVTFPCCRLGLQETIYSVPRVHVNCTADVTSFELVRISTVHDRHLMQAVAVDSIQDFRHRVCADGFEVAVFTRDCGKCVAT
jgi:hypothetical protein